MERQAHYAVVGVLTLILLTAVAAFTFWFIRLDINQSYASYNIIFDTPVDGLTKGAEVHFNGIKVGEVRNLKLGKVDTRQVVATVRLDATTPIRVDSVATIEPMGITGLFYIQITPGSTGAAFLKPKPNGPPPVIRSGEGQLAKLLAGSGSVLDYTYQGLDRINRLLSDENISTFSRSLDNLEAITAELRSREAMLDDAHEAVISMGQAADSVTRLANSGNTLIGEQAPETLKAINRAADNLGEAATGIKNAAESIEGPAQTLQTSTLPQIERAVSNLDDASRSVRNLVDDVQASPQEAISKPVTREREVRP